MSKIINYSLFSVLYTLDDTASLIKKRKVRVMHEMGLAANI